MTVVFAKDHTIEPVQKLIKSGAKVRNPQFFRFDSDLKADKVHVFGDYPAIVKAFDCEVVQHDLKDDTAPSKEENEGNNDLAERFNALPEDTKFPKHYGGGNFFLSDGSTVSGKEEAQKAQESLNEE